MTAPSIQSRILGIDLGKARIGLAISDELGLLAHPVATIPADGNALNRIRDLAKEKQVSRIVVGLPIRMAGDNGPAAVEALDFVAKLRTRVQCDVVTQDERLSTVAAQRALQESGRNTRQSRSVIDQVAAQMILQTYLDRLGSSQP